MRLIFLGTPEFAVVILKRLIESDHQLLAVVTQPDKPAGRGQKIQEPPVKRFAKEQGLPVLQPTTPRDPNFLAQIQAFSPECIPYAAYGKILPPTFLAIPPHGCLNVHASLLPKYRGAAPIQWAIINGEEVTGITIMKAEEGLDTGPILLQKEVPIDPEDTAGTLSEKLAQVGAELLLQALDLLEKGEAEYHPQDDSQATYAPLIKPEMTHLHWEEPAERLRNKIRAFNPRPGALTRFKGKDLKIWSARALPEKTGVTPGKILFLRSEGVGVATGEGILLLQEVQPAGGKKMPAVDWARGQRIQTGEGFELLP